MSKAVNENKDAPLEKQLWKSADALRKNIIDAAEYKHGVPLWLSHFTATSSIGRGLDQTLTALH